jgi:rhodanese-related sulfurtransferase
MTMAAETPLEIDGDELTELLRGDAPPVLVDVRETVELDRGILPGAMLIPMSGIQTQLGRIPKDRPVVIYCEHGVRSFSVAAYLRENHWQARSLTGGFAEWDGPVAEADA